MSEELQEQQQDQNTETQGATQEATAEEMLDEQPEVQKAEFENIETPQEAKSPDRRLEMLLDIVLPVSIELGRTKMFIKDILELERGSIIELDKMAGEPVDLYINNKKMAEGEVVVVDKHFGIRITNLIDPADRIKNLGPME